MEALRDAILYPELAEPGDVGNGRSRVDNVNSTQGGNSEAYTVARLKRDRPALAEKVIAGEMSANAAAIEAGFRDLREHIACLRTRLVERSLFHFLYPANHTATPRTALEVVKEVEGSMPTISLPND